MARRPTPIQFQEHDTPPSRLEKLKRLAAQVSESLSVPFDPASLQAEVDALDTRVTTLENAPTSGIQTIVEGSYITVDATDPSNPTVSVSEALINAVSSITRDHGNLIGLSDNDHPQYPLKDDTETISGQWTFSRSIWTADGSAAQPFIAPATDPNTGWYALGADNIGITTGGTARWDINTTRVASTLTHEISNTSNMLALYNPAYTLGYGGIEITTYAIDPDADGIGTQIAFWEGGTTAQKWANRAYGFRIKHTGELNNAGD